MNLKIPRYFLNAYGMVLALYFTLRYIFGDGLSAVALLNNCIPTLLFPSLVIFPIAIKQRKKIVSFWSLLAILFMGVKFGCRFLPKPTVSLENSQGTILRVLTHNTGQYLPDYTNINKTILTYSPDVVLLQEITEDYAKGDILKLNGEYPYQYTGPMLGEKHVGMGFLSRYPILEIDDFKLAKDGLVFQQRAIINVKGNKVAFYNIHLTFPWFRPTEHHLFSNVTWVSYDDHIRREEIVHLIDLLEKEEYPVVIGGDFNFNEQSSDYDKIVALLTDAYKNSGKGFGFTWPANKTSSVNLSTPMVRVDYIFHSSAIQTCAARVLPKTESDHKPVLVDLGMSVHRKEK